MIREFVGSALVPPEKHFRWRGGEITRLEGFTDAVFAFAVTLLVVSLEVPHTYAELITAMKGFVAFGICFAMLASVWYHHYVYSRRYGLQTLYTIVLNSILIFVVLFYVYPLKFLFTLAVNGMSGGRLGSAAGMISDADVPSLLVIYSLGYTAVFVLFSLLYYYAYKKRSQLQLNEYETMLTGHTAINHLVIGSVGLVVVAAAMLLPLKYAGLSGFLYFLNAFYGWTAGSVLGKRRRLVLERMQARSATSAQS
ncbi:MAG TPA: TMEM175 family protein [Candidatus Acidoferrales bacterium]|nr:TMEM175 family protein [Candidatus Acidoferrales bacterium]